jgi:CSLREA domain-containing protein
LFLLLPSSGGAQGSEVLPRLLVNSTADPGDGTCDASSCTLRDALQRLADEGVPQRIVFDLPVGSDGVALIRVRQPLPLIETPGAIIDGTTQPGYLDRPIVYLEGSAASKASGLVVTAADVELRALGAGNFERYGFAAIGEEADRTRFLGLWSGVAPDGYSPAPNALSGLAVLGGADDARIGDLCADCGNLLAGNSHDGRTGHGVLVAGSGTIGQRIINNHIGVDVDGGALPNDDGILIVDGGHATIGARGIAQRNVISGNRVAGIELRDTNFLQIRLETNLIGLDPTGSRAVPNDVGIFINDGAGNVAIGAPLASAANVISGNRVGIAIETRARNITVQGNRIGLDLTGGEVLPNVEEGISIVAGARDVSVGGPTAADANQITGNGFAIVIDGEATANITIQGNSIGLTPFGAEALGNRSGIRVGEATGIQIGGRSNGEGNTIVASDGPAVILSGTVGADVSGNRIGLGPLDEPFGNAVGVVLQDGARDNRIQENIFADNGEAGIQVVGAKAIRNRLTRNVFLSAPGQPIDLGADGLTSNDPDDADVGPNGLLNTPLIDFYEHDGRAATVRGSGPSGQRVEVYRVSSPRLPTTVPHSSGFGGGTELLDTSRVDGDGRWEVRVSVTAGELLTALSVSSAGDTSEFGLNFQPPPPEFFTSGMSASGWFADAIAVDAAIAELGSRVQAVFHFDAAGQRWHVFRPAVPAFSDLVALDRGDAVWIQVADGVRLFWAQPAALVSSRSVALEAGLNFVTWTGPPMTVSEALAPLTDVTEAVFRYDRESRTFALVFPAFVIGIDPQLQPHDILWLRLKQAIQWSQPRR